MVDIQIASTKMNISFLYALVTSLSFTIKFNVNSNNRQDYFIFNGPNTTAHLFRENSTLKLIFHANSSFRHYQASNITGQFNFIWDGFKVNDKKMELIKSNGDLNELKFNRYTFESLCLDTLHEEVEYSQEPVFHCRDVNYIIFAGIAIAVGLIMRSDNIIPKIWMLFNTLRSESEYAEVDTINT